MKADRTKIRRILVIKLRAMGDVLLSTIVTKNLRLAFPESRIDYLVELPYAAVLKGNPFIDRTLTFDRKTTGGLALLLQVRSERYDLVIDLFGNPRTALITRLSGARARVGFRFRWRTYAYNRVVEPRGGLVHNTQFNLDALAALGVAIQDRTLYFQWTEEDEAFVDAFLRELNPSGKMLIGVNTGGSWYTKRWGLEDFARLADRIAEHTGGAVVLTWGPGEQDDVMHVRSLMHHEPIIPPPTTLQQLGALLRRCRFVVSNDAGPMHLAAAVGTPVLGIYGPTNPMLQGPFGENHLTVRNEAVPCLGCNLVRCPIGHPCMEDLSVDTVFDSAIHLMKNNRISP